MKRSDSPILLFENLDLKPLHFILWRAGDPKNYQASCTKYVANVLAKYPNFKTVSTEAFGGRMKLLGKTLFDNVDKDKIRVWAETLQNKLS